MEFNTISVTPTVSRPKCFHRYTAATRSEIGPTCHSDLDWRVLTRAAACPVAAERAHTRTFSCSFFVFFLFLNFLQNFNVSAIISLVLVSCSARAFCSY